MTSTSPQVAHCCVLPAYFLSTSLKQYHISGAHTIDSYEKCNETNLSLNDWKKAMGHLNDDFIALQTNFEMFTPIETLYKTYKETVATDDGEVNIAASAIEEGTTSARDEVLSQEIGK